MPSQEPGVTLSRLIAVERNALAAIEAADQARQQFGELRQQLVTVQAENVQLKARIEALTAQMAMAMGSGPTSR